MTNERDLAGEQDRPNETWILARKYPDKASAEGAYENFRALLFVDDLSASVYRARIDDDYHVIILDDQPIPEQTLQTIQSANDGGTAADLDEAVKNTLIVRRLMVKLGGFRYVEMDHNDSDNPIKRVE